MTLPSYRACVLGGASIGIGVATLLAERAGVTPWLWLATAAVAACASLLLAALTTLVTGRESFAFLHYQLASIAAVVVTMLLAAGPLLPSLDLLAVALAITQAIGRIGCYSAGCCHGRGRVPVPLLESAALFAIAAFLVTAAAEPFATYLTASAVARFAAELLRGDVRPSLGRASQAQAICTMNAIAGALLQPSFATIAIAGLLLVALVVLACSEDRDALARVLAAAGDGAVITTPSGLRVSRGERHYSFSSTKPLPPRRARALARLVRELAHPHGRVELVAGNHGVWHVLVGDAA